MRLIDAFFANAAEVAHDGRCFVLGGGIEGLMVPHINVAIPSLTMLARIHFDLEECNRDHLFTLRATSPEGNDLGVRAAMQLRPQPSDHFPEHGVTSQVAIIIYGLPLPVAGQYLFDLLVNEQAIGQRPLGVAVARSD